MLNISLVLIVVEECSAHYKHSGESVEYMLSTADKERICGTRELARGQRKGEAWVSLE